MEECQPLLGGALFLAGTVILMQIARATFQSSTTNPWDLARMMVAGPLAGFGAAAAGAYNRPLISST